MSLASSALPFILGFFVGVIFGKYHKQIFKAVNLIKKDMQKLKRENKS